MEIALLLIRLVFFGIFALAGIAKFLDLEGSEKAFKGFGVPDALAKPASIALSIFEIVIAVLFLSVETAWFGAVGAASLLLLFIGQMIYQMAKGNAPDCHCFGQLHSAPVGKVSIARNIVFGALALFLVSRGRDGQGIGLADPRLDVMQLAFGIVFVTLLIAVIFYLKKISEQQVQIMRRIELMELVAREGTSVEREHAGHPHEGLPIGAVMPDFELPDLNAEPVSLANLRARSRPVLFFFLSPSCAPCKALVPEFEQWQVDLKGKVDLVFVSSGNADENLEKFGGENASKQILLQKDRELADQVKAKWTPTALLMDSKGRIASHAAAGDTAIRSLVEQIKAEDFTREFTYFANVDGHNHANKIGESVPQFSLPDIKGNEISAEFFKNKPTLVTFWSQTCPFCLEMMEELREWDKVKGQDQPNLLIFSDEKDGHEKFDLDSPVVFDEGHQTASEFGMFGTPSAVLVNEEGKIVSETAVGAPDIWALVGKKR